MRRYRYDWQIRARLAKPCPLCGCRTILTNNREYEEETHLKLNAGAYFKTVECAACGCEYTGGPADTLDGAYRMALKGWNRRAAC